MTNSGNNDNNERRIRDLMGLVKFCLDTTSNEDPTSAPSLQTMDQDRRAWLEQVISSMTLDTTKLLLENLAIVKETVSHLDKDPNHDVAVQKTCDAIVVLTDLCESIDYASDFAKLDGFSIFKPLIGCSHEELIVKACELIAALAQNNPICQNMAMQTRLLERLVDFVHIKEDQSHIKARSFALYALSSIIRSNPEVRSHFESQLDGLSVLLNLLDHHALDRTLESSGPRSSHRDSESPTTTVYWWRKLRIRSVFLFRTLCGESTQASKFFHEKQAIKQLTSLLGALSDPEVREHLLNALDSFLSSIDREQQLDSLKCVPDLKSVIQQILSTSQVSGDDFDLIDTRSTCEKLLTLIDSMPEK